MADLLSVGPEPRAGPPRLGPGLRLLVALQAAALAVAIVVAVHYSDAASKTAKPAAAGTPAATAGAAALPVLGSVTLQLPPEGHVSGIVMIAAAEIQGMPLGLFTVSATISGATPGTIYNLTGNDCAVEATPTNARQAPAGPRATRDHIWATGLAGPDGVARLTGHEWSGAVSDTFWLVLDPSPANPAPGLRGAFAAGGASPFPAGQSPCASARAGTDEPG
jgi:hypothetical protein